MSFLEQLRMKKALEEKGREEVAAKNKAEALISKVRKSIDSARSIGVDVSESQALLEQSEKIMLEKDYRQALEISKEAFIQIDRDAQDQILERYLHLRRIFSISMVPESPEVNLLLEQGEIAISTSIPDSVNISRRAYDAIYDYLLQSRPYLRDNVSRLFAEYIQEERLSASLDYMMTVEGDAETIHVAMEKVISVIGTICQEKMEWLKTYNTKLSNFIKEMEYMDIIWRELRLHFKQNDFETVKKELDLIEHNLNSQLEVELPEAFRQAKHRLDVLEEFGVDYQDDLENLETAEKKLLQYPLTTLEDYIVVMERIQERESDFITDIIQGIRDMITVGRHINIDLTDVIIGLDEVRLLLRKGDLKGAVQGVDSVKVVLLDRMSGYNELELAFFGLAELVKEVEEYNLSLEEPMKIVNLARNTMTEEGFEQSLALVKQAIQLIHEQTRELLGEKMIMAQKSLQVGFRIEADVLENSQTLGHIYQTIIGGEYKGVMTQIIQCHIEIESKLQAHAKRYLRTFLKELGERENVYDIKKMRLQARGAEKLLNEGSADESYRIIWTARRQLSNLDLDALETKLKKVRELVSTGEAVEVDVSDLKRMMFSFSYDGKNVNLEMISNAGALNEKVLTRLYDNLLQKLHRAHILAYQAKMAGYQTDEQLLSLKKAFRLLEKNEFRSAYGALKEAEIGYNIQILVHDEVYDRLLRISSIISQENLNDKEMRKSLELFQNGKYREADMESKKLLRSLIERGLKAAAAGIMEDSKELVETGDMLQLKIISLRESLPQAAFFLENGDYRNASSLMEKAIRTARSEISKALQERIANLRPRISEPMMNKQEKAISEDMLVNARSNMEAGRYQLAISIILHLEMDLEKRSMLVNRCRMAQLRAREFISRGKMLGVDTEPQEKLANQGDSLLRDGSTLLSYEALERVVDQVGDLISLHMSWLKHTSLETAKQIGTEGPDLEKLLSRVELMMESVQHRNFHAAKDAEIFILSCMEEVRINKEELESTFTLLQELIAEMSAFGMDAESLQRQLKDIMSLQKRGEFEKGLETSANVWLNFQTAFNTFQDAQSKVETLKKRIDELPPDWLCQRTIAAIEESLMRLSSLEIEEGYRSILEIEKSLDSELQDKRLKVREEITLAWGILGKTCPYELIGSEDWDLNEKRTQVLSELDVVIKRRIEDLEQALANSSWPNEQSRELLKLAKEAQNNKDYRLIIEKLQLAIITLGRDVFAGQKSINDHRNLIDKLQELKKRGIDTSAWEVKLLNLPADRIKVDRTLHLFALQIELERKNNLPRISVEHLEEHIVIRNQGPGIACKITIGNHEIGFLGINQSKSLPKNLMTGSVDLSYYSLTAETPNIIKIIV